MWKKFRLNVLIVGESLLLLAVMLGILAYFSHKALRQEAMRDAEQTLEGTLQDIDNILLSVEQSAGNVYYDLLEHLDSPDRMHVYSRKLVESNPNIMGCAIAFKPGYYPGRDLFMTYVHRKSSAIGDNSDIETTETFTDRPYTEQRWFVESVNTGKTGWLDPLKGHDTDTEPVVCFCLPLSDSNGETVGVMAVDVSINQLSKIVLAAKPSENGYSVLLAHNGSYIVHPDKEKLQNPTIFSQMESNVSPSELDAAESMLAGEHGMKEFRRGNRDWCVFYKPFQRVEWEGRSNEKLGWSVGVVYPEEDIFGNHKILLYMVLCIAVLTILVFFMLSSWILRRQLKPLKKLAFTARRIAEGNYTELLPKTDRLDEIGLLQNRFNKMQRSLQIQVSELEEEEAHLQQQSQSLAAAYTKTVDTDVMKTSFLHYMMNQIDAPSESIDNSVTTLCNNYHELSQQEIAHQVENIQRKGEAVVELLNHLAHVASIETGKEASHV